MQTKTYTSPFPAGALIRIEGLLYEQVEGTPTVGDMVIDMKDGCFGEVVMEKDGYCAVQDNITNPHFPVTEIGIPTNRLQLLKLKADTLC